MTVQYLPAKLKTGYCSAGNHDGCKARTVTPWFGKIWLCPCTCHEPTTKEEKMIASAIEMGINPADLGLEVPSNAPVVVRTQSPLLPPLPPVIGNKENRKTEVLPVIPPDDEVNFNSTAGRAAKGELEYRVKRVCDEFVSGALVTEKGVLTPVIIADRINPDNPPSSGAIGAVFDRWQAMGFAETARKPVRFIRYTDDALRYGLQQMKKRSKWNRKSEAARFHER